MKLLIVGNHTCGNRGDSAILRGLIDSIKNYDNALGIDILSRYPISSSYLLDSILTQDILYAENQMPANGFINKIKKKISQKYNYQILLAHVKNEGIFKFFILPKIYKEQIVRIKDYDVIIQVGGSFFVDLYGVGQFEHALCALYANKPIYMIGHSVGPFRNENFNKVSSYIFSQVEALILREKISLDFMREANIPENKVAQGVDTAWLVAHENSRTQNFSYALDYWSKIIKIKPTIAITFRELAPFDKRLGVTQEQYETAFSQLIKWLIAQGYQIIAFSTCTGIESYNKDDRMVALQLKNLLSNEPDYYVVMDEFNDVELGELFSLCTLTVGTRLHSAIISMNYNTPALAINYEHKSLGIMQQLNLPNLSCGIEKLIDGQIIEQVKDILDNIISVKAEVIYAVAQERQKGNELIRGLLEEIKTKVSD